jgi:hypothetical protein
MVVTLDHPAVAQARAAAEALRELDRSGRHLVADPALRRRWSTELLDELAELTAAVANAVEVASGRPGPDVTPPADQLAEALRRRRDALAEGEPPTSPVLPAVGTDARHDPRGPGGPKHRAQRHLRPVR